MRKLLILLLGMLIIIPILATAACAATATLAWDANTEADVAGYRLYYDTDLSAPPYDGTGIAEGASPIDIPIAALADPLAPAITLTGLGEETFFFAVTCYNADDLESEYSNELRVNYKPPAAPTGLRRIFEMVVGWIRGLFGPGGGLSACG